MNDKFIQLIGPFNANEELFNKIDPGYTFAHFSRCGILAPPNHSIYINGHLCEIGKTGILQYNDVAITSLYFNQDEPFTTKIDGVMD